MTETQNTLFTYTPLEQMPPLALPKKRLVLRSPSQAPNGSDNRACGLTTLAQKAKHNEAHILR